MELMVLLMSVSISVLAPVVGMLCELQKARHPDIDTKEKDPSSMAANVFECIVPDSVPFRKLCVLQGS